MSRSWIVTALTIVLPVVQLTVCHVKNHGDHLNKMPMSLPSKTSFNPKNCSRLVSNETKQLIQGLRGDIERILSEAINGSFKGLTYNETVTFVDEFGPRMSGSLNLNKSIEYLKNKMGEIGNVTAENVSIYAWERFEEKCWMRLGWRNQSMRILAMGGSVSTAKDGIEGEVIILKNHSELKNINDSLVTDKIVLMDIAMKEYENVMMCRLMCPDTAAIKGAKALLLRSATDFSMYTPHTGIIVYNKTKKSHHAIPVASITVEDADQLIRLVAKKNITLHLEIQAREIGMVQSENLYVDLPGNTKPDELTVMSAHSDSWDIGVGAMDDAGGVFISLMAAKLIKHLNLTHNRTIRTIIFTGEETGFWGGDGYYKKHKNDANKTSLMLESDFGTFKALGIKMLASENASCIIYEIVQLLSKIKANNVAASPLPGPDIQFWRKDGVPLGNLYNNATKYFWFHHTDADRVNVLDKNAMDEGTAVFAAVSYAVAQLQELLPRTPLPEKSKQSTAKKSS